VLPLPNKSDGIKYPETPEFDGGRGPNAAIRAPKVLLPGSKTTRASGGGPVPMNGGGVAGEGGVGTVKTGESIECKGWEVPNEHIKSPKTEQATINVIIFINQRKGILTNNNSPRQSKISVVSKKFENAKSGTTKLCFRG
jgi:hypothetical protein